MLALYYIRLSEFPEDMPDSSTCPKVRREKRVGRLLLRFVLKRYFHLDSECVSLYTNEHGKPYLKGFPLFFNLSHSGDWLVCAFSDTEVGADIEKIGVPRLAVAKRFFHPREFLAVSNAPEAECAELFFRYWSGKESVLKYTGSGLAGSLSSFYIEWDDKPGVAVYKESGKLPLFLHKCEVDENYQCFICSQQNTVPELHLLTRRELEELFPANQSNLLL
ncbi:4'-phosphopantetheinyl transferase family protein [Odoribacter lunatus]|uniref:4'-phosphopantetheinyl transferase family protein n=1 Tax=Odoribacter lunatus TaxID=2941335 RepID=UPI00203C1929|nr:4'-phosphopantetheinyl transferase superfamily protein [Odoribacter lunatus]